MTAEVYVHPDGKRIEVLPDGRMQVTKAGKRATTSATVAKLRNGYGAWKRVEAGETPEQAQADMQTVPVAPAVVKRPMKFKQATLDQLQAFVKDPRWIIQQKVDGIRGQLVFEPGKAPWFRSGGGGQLVSTTAAKVTGPLLKRIPAQSGLANRTYSVDGEIIDGTFWVFDLVIDGQESMTLDRRLRALSIWTKTVADVLELGDVVKPLPTGRTEAEKAALSLAVLESGGEGFIVKRLDGSYDWDSRVDHSLKIKVTHTVDAVVIDRNRGVDDNMVLALYNEAGEQVEIGNTSAIGKPDAQIGEVVEVKYLYAGQGGRLVQPTVLRMRDDKQPHECRTDQLVFVNKAVVTP